MSKRSERRAAKRGRVLGHEQLEQRTLLAADCSPWQNPVGATDANNDGQVTPVDALLVINAINSGMTGQLAGRVAPPMLQGSAAGAATNFLDCSGDGEISPIDALQVINAINQGRPLPPIAVPAGDQQPDTIGADAQAIDLTSGFAKVAAAINTDGDVDVFQVTPSDTELCVALFVPSHAAMSVAIVDASGTVVAQTTNVPPLSASLSTGSTGGSAAGPSSHEPPPGVRATVEAGSTYYLVVSGSSGVTGTYCLQVMNHSAEEYPPPPPSGGGGGDDGGGSGGETPPTPAELFARLDTDQSGSLSLQEFEALPPPPPSVQLTPAAIFAKLDANSDDSLSEAEFAVGAPAPPPTGGDGGSNPTPPTPATLFARLDADQSGSLTLTEFKALPPPPGPAPPADAVFARWDANANGLLSLEEFVAGLGQPKKK